MKIHLLYFASVRERLGRSDEALDLPAEAATVHTLVGALRARGGIWEEILSGEAPIKFAVDQQFAALETPLADGCEVAIFPPVTGG